MADVELVLGDLIMLSDVGNRLLSAAIAHTAILTNTESLLEDLKQASILLGKLKQALDQPDVHSAVKPSMDALIKPSLLKHQDEDVRLLVIKCISEIIRIGAPDAPFCDDTLKEIFELIVSSFKGLKDKLSPDFHIRVGILEIVAKTRCCVVMLDLQCDDLILEMFRIFFQTVSEEPNYVHVATRTIMCVILEESEEIPSQLMEVLLQNVLNTRKGDVKMRSILAGTVLGRCAKKLGPAAQAFLSQASSKHEWQESYNDLISAIYTHAPSLLFEIYTCAPNLVVAVIPILVDELLSDQLDIRLRAVRAVSWLFSLRNGSLPDGFDCLHEHFIKRFYDNDAAIRLAMIEGAKKCLFTDHFVGAVEFLCELGKLIGDNDSGVRLSAIEAVCEYGISNLELISVEEGKHCLTAVGIVWIDALKKVAECLQDAEILIRGKVIEWLTSLYRAFCLKEVQGWTFVREFLSWVPSKLIRCDSDQKELRTHDIDLLLSEQLFPHGFPVNERVKCWISFCVASKEEVIYSLKHVLHQKRRLQQEMHNYLLIKDKQKWKGEESEEMKRASRTSFKIIARSYLDPAKAESDIADFFMQLRDTDLLKQFTKLLEPNTSFSESMSLVEGLRSRLGEQTVSLLAVKCANLLFGKEHLQALFKEIAEYKRLGDEKMLEASMGVLVVFVSNSPSLLGGFEGSLLEMFKENKKYIKESALQILAVVREHLTEEQLSLDFLENLCTNGSCKQAKYALQVLASLSEPKVFSSLFMKLVDCESDENLPVNVFAVSRTQEEGIMNLIVQSFFRNEDNVEEMGYNNVSKTTKLKIFALKALVKVYCSATNPEGFKELSGVLLKFLHRGEHSDGIESSQVDKYHLRLAAALAVLRVSKSYGTQVPPPLFYSTVQCARDPSIYVRDQFLGKLGKLLDMGLVSHVYGSAFVLGIDGEENDLTEVRRRLADFIDGAHHQIWLWKADASEHSETPSITQYPEYALFYLVHTLAQGVTFQSISEGGPTLEAVQYAFKQLSVFISALLNWHEGSKQERSEKIGMILDIFRKIKNAEDVVDTSKTENSYILCDIGIAITKDLSRAAFRNVQNIVYNIPLPLSIYRILDATEGDGQKTDGFYLPPPLLSVFPMKMNKNLAKKRKAEGGNYKKVRRLKHKRVLESSSPNPMEKQQVDIVSSKIQLSDDGSVCKTRNSTSTPPVENLGKTEKPPTKDDLRKGKRGWNHNENGEVSTMDGKQNNTDESLKSSVHRRTRGKVSIFEDLDQGFIADLKANSHLAAGELHSGSTRNQVQISIKTLKPPEELKSEPFKHVDPGITRKTRGQQVLSVSKDDKEDDTLTSPRGTPMQSAKKIMSSGSEWPALEDKTVKASPKDLVGCRIRVWWPMDKKFYRGTVSSYHTSTKKHKVVYDDGDVEDLRLEKERWELIENDYQSTPSSSIHEFQLKKRDGKRQPNKQQPETEIDDEMSKKPSKHKKKKDVDELKNPIRDREEELTDEREESITSGSVSRAHSSGKKASTSLQVRGLQSEDSHSPTISKDPSDDLPLSAWKAMQRKSHQ